MNTPGSGRAVRTLTASAAGKRLFSPADEAT